MVGILCEKPSAARNFAKALGGQSGNYNGEQYTIVAARGHLYEYADPSAQVAPALTAQYRSWDVEHLPWNEKDFKWKRTGKKDTASTVKQIKDVLGKCSEIVIATDVDPSGEGFLLAYEVLDECNLTRKPCSRMYFDDEAAGSIQKAFRSRKPIKVLEQDPEYLMSDFRSKWDFLSMQWSRIATKCGDGRSVLRQGRLKSAMVLLVGDALAAVAAYKKVPYYQNRFRDENGVVYSNKDEPSFPDKAQVPHTYSDSAVIVDKKEKKSTPPPRLLDLAALSALLSSKGIKAKEILNTYQKMYEAQVVSYPRTEDKCITPEQFNELLPKVDAIAKVVGIDAKLLTHRMPRKTHVKTGGAHGANRPGPNVPKSLDELSKYGVGAAMIYEILARNYLAMLCEDYEYESQKGHLEKYPAFTGSTCVPLKQGYKAVFSDADDDVDATAGLGKMASPFVYEGFPPKPPTPTMKWLMAQLEKRDVGTGATRTSIYAEVTNEKAQYPLLSEKKGKLSMTEFGDMSYHLLPDTHIGDLSITEELMGNMRAIAEGKKKADDCLHAVQQLIRDDIAVMQRNGDKMRKELNIRVKVSSPEDYAAGTWNGKAVKFKKTWGGHAFTDDEIERLLRGEEICIYGLQSAKGSTYSVKGKLTEQVYNKKKFVGFEKTGYVNEDGSERTATVDQSVYCTGRWRGKDIKFKRQWSGHNFTDDECKALLAGKEVSFEATAKSGKTYTAKGKLASQTYNGVKFVGFKPDFS